MSQISKELKTPTAIFLDEMKKQKDLDQAKERAIGALDERLEMLDERIRKTDLKQRDNLRRMNEEIFQQKKQIQQGIQSLDNRICKISTERKALTEKLQNLSPSNWVSSLLYAFSSSSESREELSRLEDSINTVDRELACLDHQRDLENQKLHAARDLHAKRGFALKEELNTLRTDLESQKGLLEIEYDAVIQKFEDLFNGNDKLALQSVIDDFQYTLNGLDNAIRSSEENMKKHKIAIYQRLIQYRATNSQRLVTMQRNLSDFDALEDHEANSLSGASNRSSCQYDSNGCNLGEADKWVESATLDELLSQTNSIIAEVEDLRDDTESAFIAKKIELEKSDDDFVWDQAQSLARQCSILLSKVDKATEVVRNETMKVKETFFQHCCDIQVEGHGMIEDMKKTMDNTRTLLWGSDQKELNRTSEEIMAIMAELGEFDIVSSQTNRNLLFPGWKARYGQLKQKLVTLERIRDKAFCKQRLDKAESERDELQEKEKGISFCKDALLEKIKYQQEKWRIKVSSIKMTRKNRDEEWSHVVSQCIRILTIEENRLLGFPRNGKREGPMPVYFKRFLLKEKLADSQALVITAGTGCGKVRKLRGYFLLELIILFSDFLPGISKVDTNTTIHC